MATVVFSPIGNGQQWFTNAGLTQGGPTSQTVVAQGASFPSYFYGAQLF
jgi:hypothetical protein